MQKATFSWYVVLARAVYLSILLVGLGLFLYSPLIDFIGSGRKTLNIFAWGNSFDPDFFEDFEKETGIKLHFSYYETNEELLAKLEALGGAGYDLIVPSDYAVKQLINKELLQPLDKNKVLPFKRVINPALMGHYFDPENAYSLPLEWGVFGIGIDSDAFGGQQPQSWDIVFDEEFLKDYHPISMVDDPKEGVMIAALYLFGQASDLSDEQLDEIENLLIRQKKYVQMYTDARVDYLLATKNVVAGVSTNAYIWQAMKKFKNIDFFVPREGSFMTIEHVAIPRGSDKANLVYEFLKYVYTKQSAQHSFLEYALFPAMTDALVDLDLKPEILELLNIDQEKMKRLKFFTTDVPRRKVNDIWIALKSA